MSDESIQARGQVCHVDESGFHHFAIYSKAPWCRCGLNFPTWLAFDQHLDAVSVRTVTHDVVRGT